MSGQPTANQLPLTAKLIVVLILTILVTAVTSLITFLFFTFSSFFILFLNILVALSLFIITRILFFLPPSLHTPALVWALIAPIFGIPLAYLSYRLADLPDAWKRRLAFIGLLTGALTLTALFTPYLQNPFIGGTITLLLGLLVGFAQFKLFPTYLNRTHWLTLHGTASLISGLILTPTLTHSPKLTAFLLTQIEKPAPMLEIFSITSVNFIRLATTNQIRAIGSFLIPAIILLLGSWLINKKNLYTNFMEGFNQIALFFSPINLSNKGEIEEINDSFIDFSYTANNPDYPKLYSAVITLTPDDVYHAVGTIWLTEKQNAPFNLEFNYATWDNDGGNIWHSGDGIALMFLKNGAAYRTNHPNSGGELGFLADDTGYGLLLKTYGYRSVQLVDGQLRPLVKKRFNSYTHGKWFHVKLSVTNTNISVYINQHLILNWEGTVDYQYAQIGFSAATGGADSRQQIKNIRITPIK